MTMSSPNEFTQKDLMKHLLDVSQHAVTREQLQETERNLNRRIDEVRTEIVDVRTELKQDIADVRTEVKEVRSKLDRLQWAICGTIIVGTVTLLFKEQILMTLLS
ncbi:MULTISPECIES: hypothetical protein [Vibrio]|uniref:hypothetical protein n=1 Tax=Vibrio TaxID=662 RepID=UPI0003102BA1|nr:MULTISPECIES: hypothetical protein [Vibrio]MCF7506105.1 hypothetical protein [Vibrio sp. L3-7]MCY9829460.1 hypothetical protein [Vibrio chagasii]